MKITFIHLGYESLAVEFLSTALKGKGHEVTLVFEPMLFDKFYGKINFLNKDFSEALAKKAINTHPDLICFSASTDNIAKVQKIAKTIKTKRSVPILLGGIAPTIDTDNLISKYYIDYICIGDGTKTLPELATALTDKNELSNIENLVYKEEGKTIKNSISGKCYLFENRLLPDKDIFVKECKGLVTPIYKTIFTTGCVYNCSYCHNSFFKTLYPENKNNFHVRDIDNFIEELVIAKGEYNPKIIYFLDDSFLYDKEKAFAMLSKYREAINLPFICAVHPDFIDEKTAKVLKESGCTEVSMGFQSADENISKSILNRVSDRDKTKQAVKILKEHNIFTNVDIIMNIPTEKIETLKENARFLNETKPDAVITFNLKYYPNMPITKEAEVKGMLPQHITPDENGVITDTTVKDEKLTLLIKCAPYLNKANFEFYLEDDKSAFIKSSKTLMLKCIFIAFKFIKANPFAKRKKLTFPAMLSELKVMAFYLLKSTKVFKI